MDFSGFGGFLSDALGWGITNIGLPIGVGYLQREISGGSSAPRVPVVQPTNPVIVTNQSNDDTDYTSLAIAGGALVLAIVIISKKK